jgi:hypothetical protein
MENSYAAVYREEGGEDVEGDRNWYVRFWK